MFDIGWSELLIIGLVALIVVGPRDLPGMFRALGQFTAKAKRMAREFSQAMEQAADDAGVSDVQKTLRAATNPAKTALNSVSDSVKKAVDLDKMDPDSETAKLAQKKQADRDAAKARAKAVSDANANAEAQGKAFSDKAKAADAAEAEPKASAKTAAATKPAAKTPATKKPAAKKPAAKKPAAAKAAAKPKAKAKTAKKADT